MAAYKTASAIEIDALRIVFESRAAGWNAPVGIKLTQTETTNYKILQAKAPVFAARRSISPSNSKP